MVVENSHNRKEEIYNAAEQVFAKYGFNAAKIDEIAQLAGVAKGTVYHYFPSKQELFISLVETRISEFTVILEQRLSDTTCVEQLLRTLVVTRVQFYVNHSGMVNLLFQTMGQFTKELQTRMLTIKQKARQISTKGLQRVIPSEYPLPPHKLSAMISGSINALLVDYFVAEQQVSPDEIADQIVTAFLPGILKYQKSKKEN